MAQGIRQPKTNSLSPHAERLAEYRELILDQDALARIDRRKDPLITWQPVAFDPRFPNKHVSAMCYVNYKDYFRCRQLRGEEYEPCEYFKNVYRAVCPNDWTEAWDEDRANGVWFGDIKPRKSLADKGVWFTKWGLRKKYEAVSEDVK